MGGRPQLLRAGVLSTLGEGLRRLAARMGGMPEKLLRWTAALAAVLLLPVAAQAAEDGFMGTWRLDKARSIIANDPGVKSKEIVITPSPGGGTITETLEMKSGGAGKQVSQLRFEYGKFVPQARADIDAFLVTKDGPDRIFWTAGLKGKPIARLEVDLSKSGDELTFRYLASAADPAGKVASDRYVYDRQ